MKKSVLAVLTAAVMTIASAAAQPQNQNHKGGKPERPTPEQIAKHHTERLTKELNLTKEQSDKIYEATLKRTAEAQKKNEARREAAAEARKKADAEMAAYRQKAKEDMKAILTSEQYEKWSKMEQKRPQHGRAQGQGGPGPEHGRGPKGKPGFDGHDKDGRGHGPAEHGRHNGKKVAKDKE